MNTAKDMSVVANEALSLLRPKLMYYANDVANLLIDEFECDDTAAVVAAVMGDVNYQQCVDHAPCRDLNNWLLYNELEVRFGKIAANAWYDLMMFGLSEHNTEVCDCAMHKNDCNQETHEEQCSDDNCVLERMVRRVPLMSVLARTALLAWFIVMARKLTGRHRPVEMYWSDVRQYLGKISIIATAVVDNCSENNGYVVNMVNEIKMIVMMFKRRNTL